MSWRWVCCIHAYTVYTPTGHEGCPKGEPAVYMLIQCTTLLVMRDVLKVSLLYTCLYSVHPYWWWGMFQRWACCIHGNTVYTPIGRKGRCSTRRGPRVHHTQASDSAGERITLAIKPMGKKKLFKKNCKCYFGICSLCDRFLIVVTL